MKLTKTVTWTIRVDAIVKLAVAGDATEEDINDIVGFFVLLQDASEVNDRETLRFRIHKIRPQEIRVEPFIGKITP